MLIPNNLISSSSVPRTVDPFQLLDLQNRLNRVRADVSQAVAETGFQRGILNQTAPLDRADLAQQVDAQRRVLGQDLASRGLGYSGVARRRREELADQSARDFLRLALGEQQDRFGLDVNDLEAQRALQQAAIDQRNALLGALT